MSILDSIKKSIIRNITDEDIIESIKKVDELTHNGYELVLIIQRESGKLETVKIVGFDVIKNEPQNKRSSPKVEA